MIELTRYQKYKKTYQAYYAKHKEHCLELSHKWDQNNPERVTQLHRTWRVNHPEATIDSYRRCGEKHKDEHNEQNRKWRRTYPEKKHAGNIISKHPEMFPLADECEFCGCIDKLEHGHIDYDYPELYLTVCHRCNHWMDIEEWLFRNE